jgi:hypothetical protein
MPQIPGFVQNIARMHGMAYLQNYYGNVYHYGTPATGVTLTTTGSTVQTFGIWNPAGSGQNIIPIRARISQISGSGTVAAFGWAAQGGLGSTIAGTSPITTGTLTTQQCGNFNYGASVAALSVGNSIAKVFSTLTLAAAPTLIRWTGAGWGAPLATTAIDYTQIVDDFDGDIIVAPGTALFLGSAGAPGAATAVSLSWYERPTLLP